MFRTRVSQVLAVVAVTLLVVRCDAGSFIGVDDPGSTGSSEPVALQLDSLGAMLVEDDTALLAAHLLDADGDPVQGITLDWSSSDERILSIQASGDAEATLFAQRPGEAVVTASYDDLSASARIRVHNRPVDLIYVTGSGQAAEAGQQLGDSLAVRVVDRRGDPVSDVLVDFVVVAGGGTVSPARGSTNAAGYIRGAWTVGPVGAQEARAKASEGQARVRNMKDSVVVFTAHSVGTLSDVAVMPSAAQVHPGDTVDLDAVPMDSTGQPISGRQIAWASSNGAVASVDTSGMVTALSEGSATISATCDGVSGTSNFTVTASQGSLTITPAADTLRGIGATLVLTAEARDGSGNLISNAGIRWSSSNPGTISVDTMGTLRARAIGIAVITASAACCADATGSFEVQATEPGTVTDLHVTSVSETAVTVQWTEVDDGAGGAADYALRYGSPTISWGSANGTEVSVQGTGDGNVASYTYSGMSAGTDYEFQLAAYRGTLGTDATFGPLSNTASATTDTAAGGGGGGTALSPGSASAFGGDGQVTLSASAASGGTSPYSYQWHRATSSGFTPGAGNAVSGLTSLSDTDTGVTNGTTYYYVLVATDNAGDNVSYSQVSATPDTVSSSEPSYDPSVNTLIYQDDMSKYAGMTIDQLGNPSNSNFDPNFVGFRPGPAPWGPTGPYNPSAFEVITGRGNTGSALRIYRTGESQTNSFSWWSDNMPSTGNGAHHFFQFWARVVTASPLTGPLNVKWFMARHDGGASRFQWNTFWPVGAQHDTNPPQGTTVWMGYEESTALAQQPVGPYFSDIATPSGTWHRYTYEYKPNSSSGARDGIARMWVDGVKVMDISASAVGVTPVGGTKVWCTWSDVDGINVQDPVVSITWPSVQTTSSPAWTMDVDDFLWWTAQ